MNIIYIYIYIYLVCLYYWRLFFQNNAIISFTYTNEFANICVKFLIKYFFVTLYISTDVIYLFVVAFGSIFSPVDHI